MPIELKPLQQWICDKCRKVIKSPAAGYLEWLDSTEGASHGFKIVHHRTCYHYEDATKYDSSSASLDEFVGENGVAELLALIDPGPLLQAKLEKPEADIREWVELYRRLHVPHYEEARLYWSAAESDGYFEGANQISPYTQASLKSLIHRYGNRGE